MNKFRFQPMVESLDGRIVPTASPTPEPNNAPAAIDVVNPQLELQKVKLENFKEFISLAQSELNRIMEELRVIDVAILALDQDLKSMLERGEQRTPQYAAALESYTNLLVARLQLRNAYDVLKEYYDTQIFVFNTTNSLAPFVPPQEIANFNVFNPGPPQQDQGFPVGGTYT
jgi:hypothetical protein